VLLSIAPGSAPLSIIPTGWSEGRFGSRTGPARG